MKRFLFFVFGMLLAYIGWAQVYNVSVPFIKQARTNCPNSITLDMGTGFCGHTCSEMAMCYFEGRTNPIAQNIYDYNTEIENQFHGGSHDWCGTGTPNPNHLVWLFKEHGYEAKWYGTNAANYANRAGTKNDIYDLLGELRLGKMVFFQCGIGMGTGSQEHWMLLRGLDESTGTTKVIVNDPGTQGGNGKVFNLSTFNTSWSNSFKICLIIGNTPNQNLPIYAGSKSNPRDFDLFFLKSQIPNNETPSSINNLKLGGVSLNASVITPRSDWASTGNTDIPYTFNAETTNSSYALLNNQTAYSISFEVLTTAGNTYYFNGANQAYLKSELDLLTNSPQNAWVNEYIPKGLKWGFYKGQGGLTSMNFGATDNLTRGQAAAIIVTAAVYAHVPNRFVDISGASNFGNTFVPTTDAFYTAIHTLRNWGIVDGNTAFNSSTSINMKDFCLWLDLAMKFTSADEAAAVVFQYQARAVVNVTGTNASTYQTSINRLTKIVQKNDDAINLGKYEPLISGGDISTLASNLALLGQINITGNEIVTRGKMAKIITNIYNAAYYKYNNSTFPNKQTPSTGNGTGGGYTTQSVNDVVIIGEKFENTDLPTGGSPSAIPTITFTCPSGGSLPIMYPSDYDGSGNPQHFYWSMEKNGATLTSNAATHRSITFTAPTVTSITTWNLYSYVANNKGKAYEYLITITVNPANTPNSNAPTIQSSNITTSNPTTNSLDVSWTRGNGQYCILVAYEVAANAMDAPDPNVVYVGNPSFANASPVFTGSDTYVVYTGTGNSATISGLLSNTDYRFTVYEYNGNTSNTIAYNFGGSVTVVGTTTNLQAPTGLYAYLYSTNAFMVDWNTLPGVTGYQLEIADNPSFINPIVTQNFSTATQYVYSSCLYGNYYMRVRTSANGNYSTWSSTYTYNYQGNSIPYVSLNLPANSASFSPNSVTLSWSATCGNLPITYNVYCASFNPLGQAPVATGITGNTFTVSNLSYNQTYYWAVQATDNDGEIDQTGINSFTILPETNPPTGTLLIENGAVTTNSVSVNLNISATDLQGTVVGMRFSNDGVSFPPYWEQYNTVRPAWNLVGSGGTSTPGTKTVYAQFIDNSGNISTNITDNITLATGVKGVFIVRGKKFESLIAANQYAIAGDTVFATAGYYDLTSEIHNSSYVPYTYGVGGAMKNGVSLMGEGADKTTLFWDGMQPMYAGLVCAGNNTIQGLTLTVSVNPSYSRATLVMTAASNVTIKNCVIKNGNHAIECLAYNSVNPSNIRVERCAIYSNSGRAMNIRYTNNLYLYNNTINQNSYISTVMLLDNTNVLFKNNIVSNNSSEAIYVTPTSSITFTNNNVYNNRFSPTSPVENYANYTGYLSDQTGINGNISQDPLYTNATSGNLYLLTGSPCINTGVNVGIPYFSTAPEMGAYEYGGTGTLNINSNISASFVVTKPNGTQQTYTNGQSITNAQTGIYGIYPQTQAGYYTPNIKFVYVDISPAQNYYGNYVLDNFGPTASIYINGDNYTTQSPYVTINCEVIDEVNGLQNGEMKFSNDGVIWSNPEPISNKKLIWDMSGGSASFNAGTKTVYAKFSDTNGFWSNSVSDVIEYTPNATIKIVPPNASPTSTVLRNAILNAQVGDILLLKNGNHAIGGGSIVFPVGITIQGMSKTDVTVNQISAINVGNGYKLDNFTMSANTVQNFYANTPATPYPSIISNIISTNQCIYLNNNQLRLSNTVFKNISSNAYGFFMFYSNTSTSSLKAYNNVFDATVNNASLTSEIGVNISALCCSNNFEIKNNIFTGFDVGSTTGVSMGAAIRYTNASGTVGDLSIKNNNFYNCNNMVAKYNGVDVSKDEFSYTYNPNLTTSYELPTGSPLANSGVNELLYYDHNNSTNDIGATGGVYYNTPPTASFVISPAVGTLSTMFSFDASTSSDLETSNSGLQYRWDFNNDSIFDTPFMVTPTVQYQFTSVPTDSIVCWVFDEHFAIHYVKLAPPSVSSQSIVLGINSLNPFCSGANVSLNCQTPTAYNVGNTFALELSDAGGSFNTPTVIATSIATQISTISGLIPTTASTSSNYKLRITSSNPVSTSTVSSNFTVNAMPIAQITNVPASLTTTASTITMTGTPAGGTFTINGTAATQFNAATLGAGTHTVVYSVSQSGCTANVTQYVTVTAATVLTASTTATSICAGGNINVNYNAQGNYDAANYFTVELSDENGSFASPTVISSFMNTGTGTLACTLPQGLIQGNSYRVRVVSSLPANVGSSSTIFAVQAAPAVSVALNVSPSNTICAGDNVTFQATPTNAGTSPVYQWKLNGANVGTNLYQYSNNALQDGDVVWVEMTSNATCASVTPVVSAITNMNVTAVEVPTIESLDNIMASSAFAGNQWLLNGQPISGATGQFYEATQTGFYQVQVTINGCTAVSTPFSFTYVGIDDIQEMQGVSLYPNPTYGNFTITFDKLLNENANLEITNVLGQTLFQKELPKNETQHEFTVTEYAKGVYFINIRANGKVVSKKLILQ